MEIVSKLEEVTSPVKAIFMRISFEPIRVVLYNLAVDCKSDIELGDIELQEVHFEILTEHELLQYRLARTGFKFELTRTLKQIVREAKEEDLYSRQK